MRVFFALLLSGVLGLPANSQALAAVRSGKVALVIGNSAYQHVNKLPNPAKDAASMADVLRKAGFEIVDAKEDVGNAEMRRMVRDFSDKIRDADVALVFYAGHGIEIDGTNYLLPVDTKLERDVDVDDAVHCQRSWFLLDRYGERVGYAVTSVNPPGSSSLRRRTSRTAVTWVGTTTPRLTSA